MLGNFGVLSFMRSWNLTRFLTTCISATSFRIWTFSSFLYISETTRTNFLKSLHIIFIMYIKCLKLSLRLIYCNTLKFQDKPILWTDQKSALQHSLFWRYANFSKLMRTIHISMTSTFQKSVVYQNVTPPKNNHIWKLYPPLSNNNFSNAPPPPPTLSRPSLFFHPWALFS